MGIATREWEEMGIKHTLMHTSTLVSVFRLKVNECRLYAYSRLNCFLRRCIKLGYNDIDSATITDTDVDDACFREIYNKAHVLLHTYLHEAQK